MIESQVLTIGRSSIPNSEKAVLRFLFANFRTGSGKSTQRDLAKAIPEIGANRRLEDDRAMESTLRQVRQVINTLRVRYRAPILSDHHGYWIPKNQNDVREFLKNLEHSARAEAIARFQTYKAMRESFGVRSEFFDDQARLFDVVSSEKVL
jgi:hypothetical protein